MFQPTASCFPKFPLRSLLMFLSRTHVCDELLHSCCSQDSLFVFVFWKLDYNLSPYLSPSFHLTRSSLSFLGVYPIWEVYVPSSCEVFSHYFFKYPLSLYPSSSENSMMHMLVPLKVSHGPFRLCSLFFNSSCFCSSDLIIPIVLCLSSFVLFFLPTQICLWIPPVTFSFQSFYF